MVVILIEHMEEYSIYKRTKGSKRKEYRLLYENQATMCVVILWHNIGYF